ncbi:uncharacterized protein V1518DRAFT_403016 [Limtongia smithiae]|uniref:uncharacterized protein n=1 Tax=Limtongia smithiae TaxID=1125753 RepID=UPI0034CD97C2
MKQRELSASFERTVHSSVEDETHAIQSKVAVERQKRKTEGRCVNVEILEWCLPEDYFVIRRSAATDVNVKGIELKIQDYPTLGVYNLALGGQASSSRHYGSALSPAFQGELKMSRRFFLRIMPPVVAGAAGVYSGFEIFEPMFREERDRMIQEGKLILPEELGDEPVGTTPSGDIPLAAANLTISNVQQINPIEPLVEYGGNDKSYFYYLRHPTSLFYRERPIAVRDIEDKGVESKGKE